LAVVFEVVVGEVDCFAQFPVCFTIQLIRPYKHGPILLTCGQNNHICRYSLIRLDLNKLSHLDIFTQNGPPACFFNQRILLVIGLIIPLLAVNIIIGFLKKGKSKY
jgi:hypothetical protein